MKKINSFLLSLIISLIFAPLPIWAEKLTILHTNDIHGKLAPFDYSNTLLNVGGEARRNYLIKKFRNENKNLLVLDAGDVSQGSLIYKFFGAYPSLNFLELASYDAITLGNHELDNGVDELEENIKNLNLEVLASNIKFKNHKELDDKIKDYTIKDFNGLKIGIIGVTTPQLKVLTNLSKDSVLINHEKVIKNTVNKIINKTDYIILLSHMGFEEDKKTAEKIKGIDLIIGGHTHTFLNTPYVINKKQGKTLIIQDGEFGINIGKLTLDFDDANQLKCYEYQQIPINSALKETPEIKNEIQKLKSKINSITSEIIGKTSKPIDARRKVLNKSLTDSGTLVTSAIKSKFPQADIVIQNSAGIRINKIIPAGNITFGDIMELYPFDNEIVLMEINGKDIKSILETSSKSLPYADNHFLQSYGLKYTVNIDKQPQLLSNEGNKIIKKGERVSNITINGEPINLNKKYIIAANDYLARGGDGYCQLKKVKKITDTGLYARDIIMEYVKNFSPLSIETKDQIIIKK